jgi:hypothetical protein
MTKLRDRARLTKAELDATSPRHTIALVLSSPSNVKASNGLGRWTGFWRRKKSAPVDDTDMLVAAWKAAWMEGAQAGWQAKTSEANPHAAGQGRSAWEAGWRWAQQNPDRRNHDTPRLAHRHRRVSDSNRPITRALQLTAVGISVFWVSRALNRWARGAR